MTTNHIKVGLELTAETSCTSNIHHAIDYAQHNVRKCTGPCMLTLSESIQDNELYSVPVLVKTEKRS
jgi:hypothetical protein